MAQFKWPSLVVDTCLPCVRPWVLSPAMEKNWKSKRNEENCVLSPATKRALGTSGWMIVCCLQPPSGELRVQGSSCTPSLPGTVLKDRSITGSGLEPGFPSPVPPVRGAPDSLSVSFLPPHLLGSSSGLLLFPQAPHLSFPAQCLLAKTHSSFFPDLFNHC
jgi:hypothetical protein